MIRRLLVVAVFLIGGILGACSDGEGGGSAGTAPGPSQGGGQGDPTPIVPDRPAPYRPRPDELYPNGKQLAADIAQRVTTYDVGSTARAVAGRLPGAAVSREDLSAAIEPLVEPDRYSRGEVVYPQLSGVTPTSLGAMVVVNQELSDEDGQARQVTRVLDVRLRRSSGAWSLDRIGSVGGAQARDRSVSPAAARVLEHHRIELPDSARWDILRGGVDDALLETLAAAAERRTLGVAVIESGHPESIWDSAQPSAHSTGDAVDIYAVDGRPVIAQRQVGSPAFELASELVADGARQVGSPWVLGAGGPQSFTDDVHQDHIHLQQTATG